MLSLMQLFNEEHWSRIESSGLFVARGEVQMLFGYSLIGFTATEPVPLGNATLRGTLCI
jgi:hypothetical protein